VTADEVGFEDALLEALRRVREGLPQKVAIVFVGDDDKSVSVAFRGTRLEAAGLFTWGTATVINATTPLARQ
jgi:hypothetical protein